MIAVTLVGVTDSPVVADVDTVLVLSMFNALPLEFSGESILSVVAIVDTMLV